MSVDARSSLAALLNPFLSPPSPRALPPPRQCDLLPTRFPRHQIFSRWADFVRTILVHDPAKRPTAAQLLTHNWIQQHEREEERRLASLQAPQRSLFATLNRTASMPDLSCMVRPAALPASRLAVAGPAANVAPAPVKQLPTVSSTCSVLEGFSSRSSMATATSSASPLGGACSTSGTAVPAAPVAPAAPAAASSGSSSVPDVDMLPEGLPPSPFAAPLPPAPPRGIEAALAAEAARVAALCSSSSGSLASMQRGIPSVPTSAHKPASAVGRVAAAIRRQTKTMLNKVRWPRASREGSRGGSARSRSNSLRSVASCGSEANRSRGNSIISVGSGPGDRSRSSSLFAPAGPAAPHPGSLSRSSLDRP